MATEETTRFPAPSSVRPVVPLVYTAPGRLPVPDNVVWPQDSELCVKSDDFSHGDMAEAYPDTT